jgi:NAD(P)-dependent dehydrogenase (short-subunit alcohol dehydrogenase family)
MDRMTGPFSLQNKNIVITGASSGIGRCVAIECSKAGANVFLLARNRERLEETFNQLNAGNHGMAIADLTEVSSLESSVTLLLQDQGPVYGMVHAAGIEFTAPFSMTRPKHLEALFAVNVIAGFELARILCQKKYLDPVAGGSYVFISSICALHGQEGIVAYASSKGALLSGIRSMALELSPRKIRINAVSPSIVKTPMTDNLFETIPEETVLLLRKQHPLGFGEPMDVALSCIYLLSDASRWMTGSNLVLDGGYSIR